MTISVIIVMTRVCTLGIHSISKWILVIYYLSLNNHLCFSHLKIPYWNETCWSLLVEHSYWLLRQKINQGLYYQKIFKNMITCSPWYSIRQELICHQKNTVFQKEMTQLYLSWSSFKIVCANSPIVVRWCIFVNLLTGDQGYCLHSWVLQLIEYIWYLSNLHDIPLLLLWVFRIYGGNHLRYSAIWTLEL